MCFHENFVSMNSSSLRLSTSDHSWRMVASVRTLSANNGKERDLALKSCCRWFVLVESLFLLYSRSGICVQNVPLFVRDSPRGVGSNKNRDIFFAVCCSDDSLGILLILTNSSSVGVAWLCSNVPVYQRDALASTVLVQERITILEKNTIFVFAIFASVNVFWRNFPPIKNFHFPI